MWDYVTMLSNVNILKKKLKKLFFAIAIFCLLAIPAQTKTYPQIPLKGLFNVLKIDDIGFGHALLHSKWIENMYQYGPGKPHRKVVSRRNREQWKTQDRGDAVANLVRKFWFRASQEHQLLPTKHGCLVNIPNAQLGIVFGKLIHYVYQGCSKYSERAFIDELVKCDPQYEEFRQELDAQLRNINDKEDILKYDNKFASVRAFRQAQDERLKKEIKKLRLHYKIEELKQAIAQASEKWGKKKGFSKEKKKIEDKYDRAGYREELKEAKKKIFESVGQEIKDEYCRIEAHVKKMRAEIAKKIARKRGIIKKGFLQPINKALMYCKTGKKYMLRTVEGILWAFFFHKIGKLSSRQERIDAIKSCLNNISPEFKNQVNLEKCYTPEKFAEYEEEIKKIGFDKQIDKVLQGYDLALHYFINNFAGKNFPPKISQGDYGYEYEEGKLSSKKADCHETATLNALSILWYNQETKTFDDSLIKDGPGFKRLRQVIKYLYLADQKGIKASEYTCRYNGISFTSLAALKKLEKITENEVEALDISEVPVSYITRSEIKQEFMNIVSGIKGVIYCSKVADKKVFELETDVKNVLKIFNYFYGIKAKNFGELGNKISTGQKKVICTKERGLGPREWYFCRLVDKVKINISDHKRYAHFTMTFNINTSHTFLTVPEREKKDLWLVEEGVNIFKRIIQGQKDKRDHELTAIFVLLTSKGLLKNNKQLPMSVLNLIYYSLMMKKPDIAIKVIKDVLKRGPQNYEMCKELIHNLIKQFPDDHQKTKLALCKTIVKIGFYEKPFFKNFVKEILRDPIAYRSYARMIKLLWALLKKGYTEVAIMIMQHPQYNQGNVLLSSPELTDTEIALAIITHPKFYNQRDLQVVKREICHFILEKGRKNVVLKMIQHSGFYRDWRNVKNILLAALEKGQKAIGLGIVKHPEFYPSSGVLPEIYQEHEDIAVIFINNPLFDVNYSMFNTHSKVATDVLISALENDKKNIALAITRKMNKNSGKAHPSLEKKLKDVAETMVNNPQFDFCLHNIPDCFVEKICLILAMKYGYKDIVLTLINNPRFNVNSKDATNVLISALKNGKKDIAKAITRKMVKNSGKAHFILEKKLKDVVEAMVKKKLQCFLECLVEKICLLLDVKKCDSGHSVDHSVEKICLLLAMKYGYKDIVLTLVNNLRFGGFQDVTSVLIFALKTLHQAQDERVKDIALAIVNDAKLDFEEYNKERILECIQMLSQENPENRCELQKIIEALERKEKNQVPWMVLGCY